MALRLDRSRRTQDGRFLTGLVDGGLLAVATPGSKPFDAAYWLTDLGKHTAEFDVYEMSWEELKARSEGTVGAKDAAPPPAAPPAKTKTAKPAKGKATPAKARGTARR